MDEELMAKFKFLLMNKVGAWVKETAIRLCPVDMGDLRRSIHYELLDDETVRVYTEGVDYADKMEYGTPPTILTSNEKDDIVEWAGRHGLNNKQGRAIANSIEKRGIKVGSVEDPLHVTSFGRNSYRPFLRPAAFQVNNVIKDLVEEVKLELNL